MNTTTKKFNNISNWIFLCILASIPWVIFIFYFVNNNISLKTGDWSNFGSYIGGTVTALTFPFSFYLLIKTYQTQKLTELTTSKTLDNQKFEKRLFELISVFNEYRYNHLKGWTQIGDKPRENYNGFSFFTIKRRNIQHSKELNKTSFQDAYCITIESANLNFEFYFRCIENILTTVEEVDDISERSKLLILVNNLLTNDEKFFIKYFDTYKSFSNLIKLKSYKQDLCNDLFIDYNY